MSRSDDSPSVPFEGAVFREQARAAVEWILSTWEGLDQRPVYARVEPGALWREMPRAAPERPEAFADLLADLNEKVLPGLCHWQAPGWFGYFPANSSPPSVLADLVSAALGVQGMTWSTSPACTELEMVVMDWLVEALDLPRDFSFSGPGGGVIQDSASSATLCAVVAAREVITGGASNLRGTPGGLVAYTSREAHASVEKAMRVAGLGSEQLRKIPTDAALALRPEALRRAIAEDRRRGLTPFLVVATVGTTSTTAIDPVEEIGRIARAEGLWLHVDAALAGVAPVCPEFRYLNEGLAWADSLCTNAHKWFLTNFDCSCFWVRDRRRLTGAMGARPAYLDNAAETDLVVDYKDWHVPLGRRFRALKLWFVLRLYGLQGLRRHIRRHVEWAQLFASWVRQSDDFELVAPVPLNLVCFRYRGGDEVNRRIRARLLDEGRIFISDTLVEGRRTLRWCTGSPRTTLGHVHEAWERILEAARVVTATGPKRDSPGAS